jgi:hypothetical protein
MILRSLLLLALTTLAWLPAAEPAAERVVIWKFDDLRTGPKGNIEPMVKRVVAWATEHQTPISFGIITDSLPNATPADIAWLKQNARENGGWVEFWHHGWTHGKKVDAAGTTVEWEFKNTGLAAQVASLEQGCKAMTTATGLTFHAFGAPMNAIDSTTNAALDQVPELTVWLYGDKNDTKRTVLNRSLNLEIKTGVIDEATFRKSYHNPKQPYLALQAHPPYWNEDSFTAFTAIATTLAADGWKSETPSAYAATVQAAKPAAAK